MFCISCNAVVVDHVRKSVAATHIKTKISLVEVLSVYYSVAWGRLHTSIVRQHTREALSC